MTSKLLSGILIGIISVVCLAIFFPHSDSAIPPTPAIDRIITSNGTVYAVNYSTPIEFVGSGVTVTGSNNSKIIYLASSLVNGTGENNTAANVGSGIGIFRDKTGVTLNLHSLRAGSGIIISDIGDEIRINATGSSREVLVDQIDAEKILSSIGDTYMDIFSSANSHGHATLIDTNGMTKVRLQIIWEYAGTGTQTCQIVDEANSLNVLITSGSLSTGINDSGDISIPVGLLDTVENYKIQCKSTVATDSPSLFAFRVYLKQ